MTWMRVFGLVIVFACGAAPRSAPKPPPSIPADPTLGICAEGQTPNVIGVRTLVDASRVALDRGCPREAMLDAIAARTADGGSAGPNRALVALAVLEAGQDAHSQMLGSTGTMVYDESDLPGDAWLEPASVDHIADLLNAVGEGVRQGTVPVAVREAGRMFRVVSRFAPAIACPTVDAGVPHRDRTKMKSVFLGAWKEEFIGGDSSGMQSARAFDAAADCDLREATRLLEVVVKSQETAGDTVATIDTTLTFWETLYFPGGRVGDFGRRPISTAVEQTRRAREAEAVLHGDGESYARNARAATFLETIEKKFSDDSSDGTSPADIMYTRLQWLLALTEYRLTGKPANAVTRATKAIERAGHAKRADLLDASRAVAILASVELGHLVPAKLSELFASIERRGAVGLRSAIVHLIWESARELELRGRSQEALDLLLAARDAAKTLGSDDMTLLHGAVPGLLYRQGRLEEALPEYEKTERDLRANPDRASKTTAFRMLALETKIAKGSARGYFPGQSKQSPALAAAANAIDDGDISALSTVLQTPLEPLHELYLVDETCAARPKELAAAGTYLLDHRKELFGNDQSGDGLMWIDVSAASLMSCGGVLHDPELFRIGLELARLTGRDLDLPEVIADRNSASGDFVTAAAAWERGNREQLSGVDARGALQTSQTSGRLLEQAAVANLSMTPARVPAAVALLEQSRARDLRAARASRRPDTDDPAEKLVLAKDRQVGSAAARVRALVKLQRDGGAGDARSFDAAIAKARNDVARLTSEREAAARQLQVTDQRAYRAAALAPPISMAELQTRLLDDEVLIYYLVRTFDAYALVIDRHSAQAVSLQAVDAAKLPSTVTRLNAYRRELRDATEGRGLVRIGKDDRRPTPTRSNLATIRADLYNALVRPLEPLLPVGKRVLIVPDENTADLAFAELGTAERPWIARNPIRILPGTYLLDPQGRNYAKGRALVVGDAAFGVVRDQDVWAPLPGTRKEAIEVARALGTTPILGADVTEEIVKRQIATAPIIHLATHGMADPLRPEYSMVVLSAPKPSSTEDGFLHGYEIEHLRLSATLVVLSACETGKGHTRGSEGVLALDRAFLLAGANTVISSLWVVPDDATAAMMTRFYTELTAKHPPDVALAIAMNYVRVQPKWADPLYWAAFRVVGGAR